MCVRFNVLECCSTDLLRHCHRYPLSRHSRIRRPWMLSQPFPCRPRRHEGHPFGSYHRPRESQHHRCEMRRHTCGLWNRLYERDLEYLVIILGLVGRSRGSSIILDYGSENHRRYIGVSNIAAILSEKQVQVTEALLGVHGLPGCDFTSCFFRKGTLKPFPRLVADMSDRHVTVLRSLTSDEVDMPGVTSFVCLHTHERW